MAALRRIELCHATFHRSKVLNFNTIDQTHKNSLNQSSVEIRLVYLIFKICNLCCQNGQNMVSAKDMFKGFSWLEITLTQNAEQEERIEDVRSSLQDIAKGGYIRSRYDHYITFLHLHAVTQVTQIQTLFYNRAVLI
jgi:hypothetical protein